MRASLSFSQQDGLQLEVPDRVGDEPQVHDVPKHALIHLICSAILDMHVYAGATFEKAFHARRQQMQTESINGRHADVA